MTATRKPIKHTEVNVEKKVDKVDEKTCADKALDQERFNNARKALREYWNKR